MESPLAGTVASALAGAEVSAASVVPFSFGGMLFGGMLILELCLFKKLLLVVLARAGVIFRSLPLLELLEKSSSAFSIICSLFCVCICKLRAFLAICTEVGGLDTGRAGISNLSPELFFLRTGGGGGYGIVKN